MSLIICPDCGNECSPQAIDCPKCGHPFAQQIVETPIIEKPTTRLPDVVVSAPMRKSGFPNWAFIPLAIALGGVLLAAILLLRGDEADNTNRAAANVRINDTTTNGSVTTRTTTTTSATDSQTVAAPQSVGSQTVTTTQLPSTVSVPSTSIPSTIGNASYPSTASSSAQTVTTQTTTIPDRGNVALKATVINQSGHAQPVKAEKFYLLNKDLETILRQANIELETGDYTTTLGTALADPSRRELLKECLAAITPHIIERTQTDAAGSARFKNVKPNSYYLFGIHKIGDSVSVWNTSVTVNPGENVIDVNGTTSSGASSSSQSLSNSSY